MVVTLMLIDSSTIGGKVELICTLSVQLYSYVTSVNLVFVPDKIIDNSDSLRIFKAYLTVKISKIYVLFSFRFYTFLFSLGKDVN